MFKIPYTNIQVGNIKNVDKRQSKRDVIIQQVTRTALDRIRTDVGDWTNALTLAEDVDWPDRADLAKVYRDVRLDMHLTASINTRVNKILSNKYYLTDVNGDILEEETKLIESVWFQEYMRLTWESKLYGHRLIQFGAIVDNEFESVTAVPYEYVVPEKKIVKKDLYISESVNQIQYLKGPYNKWVIEINEGDYEFGILNNAAPYVLFKKNAVQLWSQHGELFADPLRVGKTDIMDDERRKNMLAMFEGLGSSGSAVISVEDEVAYIDASRSDGHMVFKELAKYADESISKLILGGTSMTDEKSFVGSAEVQSSNFEQFITSDKRFLRAEIIKKLIPLMKYHGMISDKVKDFKWDSEENLSILQKKEIIKDLSPMYEFDPKEVSEAIGFDVKAKIAPEKPALPNGLKNYFESTTGKEPATTVMNEVANLYKHSIK